MADRATGYRTTQERQTDALLDKYSEQLAEAKRLEKLSEAACARLDYWRKIDPKLAMLCDDIESALLLG